MIKLNFRLQRDNFDVEINNSFSSGITGIYGPSGSGKTSIFNCISGLEKPCDGEISINENLVFSKKKKINQAVQNRNIGYVFQEGRLFPHMSVENNLLYGVTKKQQNKINYTELIELLKIEHIQHSKPAQISGGEWQRTALARSLLASPEILLLDEPFSAVDTKLRDQIIPYLLKIHKRFNIPILVVSHDITDLLKLTNQLFIISKGKCVGHGNYYRLIRNNEVQNMLHTNMLINSVPLKVDSIDHEKGLTCLSTGRQENKIQIVCENTKSKYTVNSDVRIFIKPDEIALSESRIEGITIQNQLAGTINDVIRHENTVLCIVDVGFPLIVEITTASLIRMHISVGQDVWCLFKSTAIEVAE